VPVSTTGGPDDCAECAFEASAISEASAEEAIRILGPLYHAALTRPKPEVDRVTVLRRRPDPQTWSALEYAAHTRDVIALWGWALHKVLTEERPELPPADPELPERAAFQAAYNTQDPATVDLELTANAERMANKVATISSSQWRRAALFGDTEVTSLWIVRKVAHEGHHHLLDIAKSLRGRSSD
jgi:hypothetical protein